MWSIRLKGETLDLQLLQQMLIAAELNIRQNDGNYYLTGTLFDQLADAEEIQAFARDLIQKINGAGKVVIDGYISVDFDHIVRQSSSGPVTSAFRDTAARFKLRKAPTAYAQSPSMRSIVMLSLTDDAVEKVLRIQESRPLNFVELYKVVDVISNDLGGIHQLRQRNWVPKTEISRFTQTANHPGAAGDEARHGFSNAAQPKRRMSLPEAQALVRQIIHRWVDKKV